MPRWVWDQQHRPRPDILWPSRSLPGTSEIACLFTSMTATCFFQECRKVGFPFAVSWLANQFVPIPCTMCNATRSRNTPCYGVACFVRLAASPVHQKKKQWWNYQVCSVFFVMNIVSQYTAFKILHNNICTLFTLALCWIIFQWRKIILNLWN